MNTLQEFLRKSKTDRFTSLMRPLIFSTAFRYFLVILAGYSVDFLIFTLLVFGGVSIYWSNTAAFCVGSIINVLLIRRFIFRKSRFSALIDLQLSLASNGVVFFCGMGMLWGLVELANINPLASKLLANAVTFFANYIIRLVFFRGK